MPKLTWMNRPPKVNYLRACLIAYKEAAELTSEQIAAKLDCSPGQVRNELLKPAEEWKIGRLKQYCDVLHIPYEKALAEAAK